MNIYIYIYVCVCVCVLVIFNIKKESKLPVSMEDINNRFVKYFRAVFLSFKLNFKRF